MKCFEIKILAKKLHKFLYMNLKHEMFWNLTEKDLFERPAGMNLKHEMFWNTQGTYKRIVKEFMNLKHEMF